MNKYLQVILITVILLLTGCGNESKYETEDKKLEVYAVNTAKVIREALSDTNISKGCFQNEETGDCEYLPIEKENFLKVEPWINMYMTDINTDKLSTDQRLFYEDSIRSIRVYKDMVDAAKNQSSSMFEILYNNREEEQFLRIASDYYPSSQMNNNYDPIEEVADITYNLE